MRNYGYTSYGQADLVRATRKSINTVYAQLIAEVGGAETAEVARRLGVTSIDPSERLYGSIALGSHEVAPLEMASAYAAFAARGMAVEPTPVLRITRRGEVLEDNTAPDRGKPVLPETVADTVNHILRGVITAGTGFRADIGVPAAGKTGTSQNYGNAWFVGYTPALSTAVWTGYLAGNIPMLGIHGIRAVAGGTMPARIWHDFMAVALRNVPPADFAAPALIETAERRIRRAERAGLDPGDARAGSVIIPPARRYYTAPPRPRAVAPPRSQRDPEGPPDLLTPAVQPPGNRAETVDSDETG